MVPVRPVIVAAPGRPLSDVWGGPFPGRGTVPSGVRRVQR